MPGPSKMTTKPPQAARLAAEKDRLAEIPMMRKANTNQRDIIPACLELNDTSRTLMQEHLDLVGLDKHCFLHNIQDQSEFY